YPSLAQTSAAQRQADVFIAAALDRVAEGLVPWGTTLKKEVRSLLDQHNEQGANELARAELAPLAQRPAKSLATDAGKPHAARQLPRVADAYRLSGRFGDALALYDQLMVDQPSAAALLFGRAECLFHLAEQADAEQRLGEAMLLYRRLSTAGPSV